jgi:hypothetical protein
VDDQPVLVDQARSDHRRGQVGAGDAEVIAVLRL